MAAPMEKMPLVMNEETCWRRPPTSVIVAEAEPEVMNKESSDSSKDGHDTLRI